MEAKMTKKRVRLRANRKIRIHNDIGNAAYYFKNRVNERSEKGDRDGIGLEMIAGLILLAFEVEARFNFLGATLLSDWDEQKNFYDKIKAVCEKLGVKPDFSKRPFASIEKLQTCRNAFAHGKPQELSFDKEVTVSDDELETVGILKAEWEAYVNEAFFHEAYDDAEGIWRDLITKSGMNVFDTLSGAERQISFIENAK
jgi:hypothetical protein